MSLPDLPSVTETYKRLQVIFPEGSPNRNNCTSKIAARTIFVMLYAGAVEGLDVWIRPDQVTRMTDRQANSIAEDSRTAWLKESLKSSKGAIPGRWYAVNTRESIRDDTIRAGLVAIGVVVERAGVSTTSPAPRYALKATFAALFNPNLEGISLESAIAAWQEENLSAGARARIAIRRKGAVAGGTHVLVTFPNRETRRMAPGESSLLSKAVIEVFTAHFLEEAGVILLSESNNKIVARDDELAKSIGLHIQAHRNLPDIVLADLGPKHPLLIFVEVVSTDGAVTPQRKEALLKVATAANFPAEHVAFVTAYLDRGASAFKRTFTSLAWGTFVWFASEPENLLRLYAGKSQMVKRLFHWD